MQAGSLAVNDVLALKSFIRVEGVERSHESWSIARDLVGDLPDQVVAGGGIRHATGTIVWADQEDITETAVNPWNASPGWVPETGQRVTIYVGDGSTWWQQFEGVIDVTTGDVGAGMQSTIVDNIDRLSREVQHSTVFRYHPPTVDGGEAIWIGMGTAYVVDRAARACGYYSTPRLEPGSLVSVPGQISLWADNGECRSSLTHPFRRSEPWGLALSGFNATYAPGGSAARTDPVQLTVRVGPDHAGTFTMAAVYGALRVQLVITPGRVASARLDGVEVCSLPLGAETIVTLLVKAGAWTIRTKTGTVAGTQSIPTGAALSLVSMVADANSRVAGMQVSKPTVAGEFVSLNHVDSFHYDGGSLAGDMSVLSSFEKRTAKSLLEDISKATLAPFWFDETGMLQMISSNVLSERGPVQKITTADDITKLSWSTDRLSVRSKVTIQYRDVATSVSRRSSINLWSGSKETLEGGDVRSFFVTEPADEDWAEPGKPTDGTIQTFNRGHGSWVGGYLEDEDGNQTSGTGYASWTQQRVSQETVLYKVTVNALPTGTHYVCATEDSTGYSPSMRGMGQPIYRGRGKATWADATLSSTITGPAGFPELVHDTGPWISKEDDTELIVRVADFIANQVIAPQPVITGMEVIYDPRRQLGDVITISSPTYMGVELRVLIVGIRNAAGGNFTQSLDVRVISTTTAFTTYARHEAAYPDSLTYEQWRVLYPDTTTYDGFNTEPLRGAP